MTSQPEPFFELDAVRRMAAKWAVDCGHRVAEARTRLGWDRRTLAGLVGTTEATIHRVESGALNPRDHLKFAIASALSVEISEIWQYPTRERVFAEASAAVA
jgi:DNA-binding XRE family transcriptional regulator